MWEIGKIPKQETERGEKLKAKKKIAKDVIWKIIILEDSLEGSKLFY